MSGLAGFRPVLLTRAAGAPPETLEEYRAGGGYRALEKAISSLAPEAVIAEVEAAGLRGRGGAAFPTARKWALARAAPGRRKHLVANGGEHEPGSRKDRVLLETRPHLVLEGMLLAGWATGASEGVLYLIEDMRAALAALEGALDEARGAGLLGEAVLGSELHFAARVVLAPASYVAGEETAALEVIEGRLPLPRRKPPYPGEAGLHGQPTTVNNVETLAQVPGILREGAAWFRALGVPGSGGSVLCTLPAALRRPGVVEAPYSATLRDLIEGLGGGLAGGGRIKGVLPALSSSWLPGAALDGGIAHDEMRARGSALGCGGLSLLAEGDCAACRAREIADFFMSEQCGQCPPCRMETNTIAAVLGKLGPEAGPGWREQIEKVAAFTAKKGYCSLIEMAAAPVLSAIRLFPEDFARHLQHGPCAG